jgi:hypothetical protein
MRGREMPRRFVLATLAVMPIAVSWCVNGPLGLANPGYGEPPCPAGNGCEYRDPSPSPGPSPSPSPSPSTPEPPQLLAPYGTLAASQSGFLWRQEPNATDYRVRIEDAAGAIRHEALYPAPTVCVRGRCLARPGLTLAPGVYRWRVGSIESGTELISEPMEFLVSTAPLNRVLYHSQTTGHVRAWFLDGTTKVGEAPLPAETMWDWNVVGTGDFMHRGSSAILWGHQPADGAVAAWEMTDLEVIAGPSFPPVGAGTGVSAVADFNRDGNPDLVVHNASTETAAVWYMNGATVLGTDTLPSRIAPDPSTPAWCRYVNWYIVGAGDFNRDLWPDILWRNAFTGEMEVWYMQQQVKIGTAVLPTIPRETLHVRGVADVDADGDADVLLWSPSTGSSSAQLLEAQPDDSLTVVSTVVLGTDADLGWRMVGFLPGRPAQPAKLTVNGSSSSITIAPGAIVTVGVTGGPGLPWDWVAKHVPTAPNNAYFNDWKYLDGSQTQPTTGRQSATLSFTMPAELGDYNFLFFRNDTHTWLATSPTVKVVSPARVTVNGSSSPLSVPPGAVVSVGVTNGPGYPWDWVTKHALAAANNVHSNDWKYLDGSQVKPETGQSTATLSFTMPTTPGDFEFRLFQNDTYTLLAKSATVTVTPPTVTVNGSSSPLTVAPGAVVTVQVAGGSAYPWDWVAKHEWTAANNVHFGDWKYLDGSQAQPAIGRSSATLSFAMPTTPGGYNFRLFYDDSAILLATSPMVTVAGP